MSLFNDASICITPNGFKAGKLYAVKGADLDVTRATSATRVNANGVIETMGANVPRIDYSGGGCPSILVEPQRTNLALYSEQFDNASWIKFGSTSVTPNTALSPDGTLNADTVITSGSSVVRQTLLLSLNTVYTYSVFVKKTNYDLFGFQNLVNGSGVKSIFNLSNGTVDTQGIGHTASIINYTNGWYRCVITFNAGISTLNIFDLSADGNSTTLRTFYCYGAMSELGSYATSYIKTTTASVTRNADLITLTPTTGLTEIKETFENGTTNVITTIPSTYTMSQGRIKNVVMK